MPAAGPTISGFTASPSPVVVGNAVLLNVTASGGVGNLSYWYFGLPFGCVSQNQSTLFCIPRAAQHYNAVVVVNDSANGSARAGLSIDVTTGYGGPPTIQSFVATPTLVSTFQTTLLWTNATSSSSTPTASLSYQYLDLPKGCASFNQTPLTCIPTEGGTFELRVVVSDGFGAFAVATTWLNVSGGGSAATPSASPGTLTWIPILIIVLVVAVVIVLAIRPRQRRPIPSDRRDPPVPSGSKE